MKQIRIYEININIVIVITSDNTEDPSKLGIGPIMYGRRESVFRNVMICTIL